MIECEATDGFNSTYFEALAFNKELGATRGIDAALQQHKLDALVLPATGYTTVPAGKNYFWLNSSLMLIETQRSLDIPSLLVRSRIPHVPYLG